MPTLTPYIRWPGVLSAVSVRYTVGHGIAPARAVLVTNPQPAPPAPAGDLTFGDGVRAVRLRDCLVDAVREEYGPSGRYYVLEILDRRWRWLTGRIDGEYNRLDERGKLVPWTVRSPTELAELCLRKMGERRYQLRLPKGLGSKDVPKLERLLRTGENFPQSFANPPVVWAGLPPAVALQRLAEFYGCRVAWDPATDLVGVGPLGAGGGLPAGGQSVAVSTAGVEAAPAPAAVGVLGAPTRHQMRFYLEGVAEEWDGADVPMDEVSYAPRQDAAKQVVTADLPATVGGGGVSVTVAGRTFTSTAGTGPAAAADLAGQVNAAGLTPPVSAAAAGAALTLTGGEAGRDFAASAGAGVSVQVKQAAARAGASWAACPPPEFPAVRATDRLTYDQAVEKARRSVYRRYRILIDRPDWAKPGHPFPDGKAPPPGPADRVKVPGGGAVVRRHQFVLAPTKVEMLAPDPRRNPGQAVGGGPTVTAGVLPDYYDGFAREREATAAGTYCRMCVGGVTWFPDPADPKETNLRNKRVYVPFAVDPERHLIVFAQPVYALDRDKAGVPRYAPARLVLETAALFLDADTGAARRPEYTLELGGPGPAEWRVYEDVRAHLVGEYQGGAGASNEMSTALVKTREEDFGDARGRARYYLDGMAAAYQLKASQQRRYNGVFPVSLTGKVQQVGYEVGLGGVYTTAGLNTEFAWNVPPYPARRLPENLPPNEQARQLGLLEDPARAARLTRDERDRAAAKILGG